MFKNINNINLIVMKKGIISNRENNKKLHLHKDSSILNIKKNNNHINSNEWS